MIYDKEIHKTDTGYRLVVRYNHDRMSAKVEQDYLTFEDVRKAYDELAPCYGDIGGVLGPPRFMCGKAYHLDALPEDLELTPIEEAVYSC